MTSTKRAPRGGSKTRKINNGGEPGKNQISPEAFQRGQIFQALLTRLNYPATDFARDSGISNPTVWMYLNGELDIARMKQPTVEKFLGTLNLPDTWAWSHFEIPEGVRGTWRTFRPPPMGHGEDRRRLLDILLDMPLTGDFSAPTGGTITVNEDVVNEGPIVSRLSDRYVVTTPELIPLRGQILGSLTAIRV